MSVGEELSSAARRFRFFLELSSAGSNGLTLGIAGLFVVLVLAEFLKNTRLLKLFLEPPQSLFERLALLDLYLRQRVSPLPLPGVPPSGHPGSIRSALGERQASRGAR